MSNSTVRVMLPLRVDASMLKSGTTIAEPDTSAGEVAWVAAGNYAVDDLRTDAGSVWSCVKAHSGDATPPSQDVSARWLRSGPTNLMAPFDQYRSTAAKASGAAGLTYILQPGFFDAVHLDGVAGASYAITVEDTLGGAVIANKAGELFEQALGLWELLFSPLRALTRVDLQGIPLSPTAVLTVTIAGPQARLGDLRVGDWRYLAQSDTDGVEYGATGARRTYTTTRELPDGTYETVLRPGARDVRCRLLINRDSADYADALLGEVADRAVPFIATDLPGYGYLATIGFVTGEITAVNAVDAALNLTIKGTI